MSTAERTSELRNEPGFSTPMPRRMPVDCSTIERENAVAVAMASSRTPSAFESLGSSTDFAKLPAPTQFVLALSAGAARWR